MQASSRMRQRGSGLLTALFVIVAGSLIGAALVQLSSGANQINVLQIADQRARFAAAAGLEWSRYRIDRSNACAAGVVNLGIGALRGFRVTTTCARTTHDDGGVPRVVYSLSAFAQYASFGSPDYVSERVFETLVR
jgi:hypothetical protein